MTNTAPASDPRGKLVRTVASAGASFGAFLGWVLLPKCPLCIAAVLSAIGLGAAGAELLAPVLRPLLLALMVELEPRCGGRGGPRPGALRAVIVCQRGE